MSDFATLAQPINLIRPPAGLGAAPQGASPDRIKSVAQQFEASFIGQMLQPMFDSLSTAPPFGGGAGESAFRSFFVDAVAKQMVKSGGIGLASAVQREMIRMQSGGAAAPTTATPPAAGDDATPATAVTPVKAAQ